MKAIMLLAGVAMSASSLLAGETLQVKLVPDRGVRVRNRPQEVVVKIDLSAIAEKRKSHRTPLNLDGGQYDSATRKTMQSQSYDARNSK
jgi:hypothetical protein